MNGRIAAILFVVAFSNPAAFAQTVGMGATSAAYTSQAAAAISKVVSEKTPFQMRVQPHGGTGAYVPLVNKGTLEFGLANELETLYAVQGQDIYKGRKQDNVRIASVLTPFSVAVYVRKDSDIRSLKDLRGKRVPSGWASQKIIGVLMEGELANAGLAYKDVRQVPVPNVVKGADDFAAGRLDAFFFATAAGKVQETDAKVGGIRALPLDPSPEAMARTKKHVPVAYARPFKPSPAMAGIVEPTHLMAYDYLVLTNAKVPEQTVYQVVKAMHDNKKELASSFPALNGFNPEAMAKDFPGVQYHPGAIRYYKEIGQWPPKPQQ